jgi:hypothetical protein
MKRLIATFALLAALATASTGCTMAGAIAGGAAASHHHDSDDDMTTGEGAVAGALVGLAIDAAIILALGAGGSSMNTDGNNHGCWTSC